MAVAQMLQLILTYLIFSIPDEHFESILILHTGYIGANSIFQVFLVLPLVIV